MIFDHLSNISLYKGLSPDIAPGTYQLTPRVKAIVSEYETKRRNELGFEAHRKNIDIQYLFKGEERIACMPIEKLTETEPYSEEKDATFYAAEGVAAQTMTIGGGYFAIFFPQEGHMPQLCVDEPQMVKKVVVKVAVG